MAMEALNVVFLVLVAMVIASVIVRSVRRKRMLARLSPRELAVHEECVAGDKAVTAAQRAYDQGVKGAEKTLKKAMTPKQLASAGSSNWVTPISLRLNGNDHDLTQDVVAALDITGTVRDETTQRTSLTRIAVGGLVAGPIGAVVGAAARKTEQQTIDTREHYVMVTGPDWQEVVKLGPEAGEKARSLGPAINVAAKNGISAHITHAERIGEAERELARATADTAALDKARGDRAALGEDPLARLIRQRKSKAIDTPAQPPGPTIPGVASFDDPREDGPQDTLR